MAELLRTETESRSDIEIKERQYAYMRLVGKLEAAGVVLKDCAQHVDVSDRRTRDLLEQADRLANKAFLAAWEYSEDMKGG